jgi:acetate kinase
MGLTPLEGLVMGTRCGDMDPAVIFYMARRTAMSLEELDATLNQRSGLLGVSGVSNDMRDLLQAAEGGNPDAALALELFVYRIVKYVGAYNAILPACDAVVLTGGIGEHAVGVRARICRGLQRLGAVLDEERNRRTVGGAAGPITADGARLPVWVVPTDEELMIARDTRAIVEARG